MKWFVEYLTRLDRVLFSISRGLKYLGNFGEFYNFLLKIMENHELYLPKKEANHDAGRGILVENMNSRIYIQI